MKKNRTANKKESWREDGSPVANWDAWEFDFLEAMVLFNKNGIGTPFGGNVNKMKCKNASTFGGSVFQRFMASGDDPHEIAKHFMNVQHPEQCLVSGGEGI